MRLNPKRGRDQPQPLEFKMHTNGIDMGSVVQRCSDETTKRIGYDSSCANVVIFSGTTPEGIRQAVTFSPKEWSRNKSYTIRLNAGEFMRHGHQKPTSATIYSVFICMTHRRRPNGSRIFMWLGFTDDDTMSSVSTDERSDSRVGDTDGEERCVILCSSMFTRNLRRLLNKPRHQRTDGGDTKKTDDRSGPPTYQDIDGGSDDSQHTPCTDEPRYGRLCAVSATGVGTDSDTSDGLSLQIPENMNIMGSCEPPSGPMMVDVIRKACYDRILAVVACVAAMEACGPGSRDELLDTVARTVSKMDAGSLYYCTYALCLSDNRRDIVLMTNLDMLVMRFFMENTGIPRDTIRIVLSMHLSNVMDTRRRMRGMTVRTLKNTVLNPTMSRLMNDIIYFFRRSSRSLVYHGVLPSEECDRDGKGYVAGDGAARRDVAAVQ